MNNNPSAPSWALPKLSTVPVPFKTARARLGAQAANSKLSGQRLAKRGKVMHMAWMKKTTQEQRTAWAKAAGKVRAEQRWGTKCTA